jgi:hypothetical protein
MTWAGPGFTKHNDESAEPGGCCAQCLGGRMDLNAFWQAVDTQLAELRTAQTADDVVRILATDKNPYGDPHITSAPAFFAGSGGDGSVYEALRAAGWDVKWMEASYHWAMRAPDGQSGIRYVEGDIYPEEPTRWACGCLRNEAGAHRVGCPDHPEGVNPRG